MSNLKPIASGWRIQKERQGGGLETVQHKRKREKKPEHGCRSKPNAPRLDITIGEGSQQLTADDAEKEQHPISEKGFDVESAFERVEPGDYDERTEQHGHNPRQQPTGWRISVSFSEKDENEEKPLEGGPVTHFQMFPDTLVHGYERRCPAGFPEPCECEVGEAAEHQNEWDAGNKGTDDERIRSENSLFSHRKDLFLSGGQSSQIWWMKYLS